MTCKHMYTVKHHDMNRAALIDQIQQATGTLQSCWLHFSLHLSSWTDLSPTFINPGGNTDGRAKQPGSPANKSSGAISSFRIAESLGFKGDFRQWEHLLRVGDSRFGTF